MLGLGRSGLPTMKRPGGLMKPRGPGFLLLLLVLTLAAMWFWGRCAPTSAVQPRASTTRHATLSPARRGVSRSPPNSYSAGTCQGSRTSSIVSVLRGSP